MATPSCDTCGSIIGADGLCSSCGPRPTDLIRERCREDRENAISRRKRIVSGTKELVRLSAGLMSSSGNRVQRRKAFGPAQDSLDAAAGPSTVSAHPAP